jgi:hypothetical protein
VWWGDRNTEGGVTRLTTSWESKMWPWVLQDSEPKMTVQAKDSRNLPETVSGELQGKEHVLQVVRVVLYGTTRVRNPSYFLHQTTEIEHISEIWWFSHYKTKTSSNSLKRCLPHSLNKFKLSLQYVFLNFTTLLLIGKAIQRFPLIIKVEHLCPL